MIRELHLDLSQLTVSPDPSRGRMVSAPAMTPRTSTERAAMKASMELEKPLNAKMGAALDVLGISETRPAVSVIPSPVVPMASRHSFDLTCALGETGTAGWVLGANASGGIYASTTPEFGVYGSVGVVFGMFAGIGAGLEWTMIFGTPSDFAGPFICFQASVGPKIFGGCAIGGQPALLGGGAGGWQGLNSGVHGPFRERDLRLVGVSGVGLHRVFQHVDPSAHQVTRWRCWRRRRVVGARSA